MNRALKQRKATAVVDALGQGAEQDTADPPGWSETLDRARSDLRRIDVQKLVILLNQFVRDAPDLLDAAIAWIDLIQVLVQNTEERYRGTQQGPLKKDEVRSAVRYLMRSRHPDVPDVVSYLRPVVVDVIADFMIDAIVTFLNRYRDPRWMAAQPGHLTISQVWRSTIGRAVRFVLAPFGWLVQRLYFLAYPSTPLSPALRSALQAVEAESDTARKPQLMAEISDLGKLIAENRDSLIAGTELVSAIVKAVEEFMSMTGPQKKVAARRLIYMVLDQLGFDSQSLVVSVKVDFAADFLIDASVHMFNKRELFTHRTSGTLLPRAATARR